MSVFNQNHKTALWTKINVIVYRLENKQNIFS